MKTKEKERREMIFCHPCVSCFLSHGSLWHGDWWHRAALVVSMAHGTCATFPLVLWECPNKGEFYIHKLSFTQLLHIKKLFVVHEGKLDGKELNFSNPLFLPLENIDIP